MDTPAQPSDEALSEALRQLELLDEQAEDRRRNTDAKLSAIQGTSGLVLTVVAGFVGLIGTSSRLPPTAWTVFEYLALGGASFFFVWAMQKVRKASDPQNFQQRTVRGVIRILRERSTKTALLEDAINDYSGLIDENNKATDIKLTYYRAAIENIIKGVYCLAAIPIIAFASILWMQVEVLASEHHQTHSPKPPACARALKSDNTSRSTAHGKIF
jgi:hypothetical protein